MNYEDEYVRTSRHISRLNGHRIGAERPFKPQRVSNDKGRIKICLNCDKPKCRGVCEKLKKNRSEGV